LEEQIAIGSDEQTFENPASPGAKPVVKLAKAARHSGRRDATKKTAGLPRELPRAQPTLEEQIAIGSDEPTSREPGEPGRKTSGETRERREALGPPRRNSKNQPRKTRGETREGREALGPPRYNQQNYAVLMLSSSL
jgi:hypothetical protein